MIEQYGKLPNRLASYTTEIDMEEILVDLELEQAKFSEKFYKLNRELASVVQSHSLVSFFPIDVSDKNSISFLLIQIDKANGYLYLVAVIFFTKNLELTFLGTK